MKLRNNITECGTSHEIKKRKASKEGKEEKE